MSGTTPLSTHSLPSSAMVDEFSHGLIDGPYGISTMFPATGTRATIIRSIDGTLAIVPEKNICV